MNLFKMLISKISTTPSYYTILIIAASLSIGMYLRHYSKEVDSKIEQMMELILAQYGIEIDFSEHKKEKNG